VSNLLPPFHKVMSEALECHLANDRIAALEAVVSERDKMLEGLRLSIVRRKQEAALYGDSAEWEGLAVALGLVDDALGRARANKEQQK